MARRNSWLMPGNGILSSAVLDAVGGPNEYRSNVENESSWAQAVREAWEKQLKAGPDLQRHIVSNQASLPISNFLHGSDSPSLPTAFLHFDLGSRTGHWPSPSEINSPTASPSLQAAQPTSSNADANIDASPFLPAESIRFGSPQPPARATPTLADQFISPQSAFGPDYGGADNVPDLDGWPTRPAFAGTTTAEGVLPTSVQTWRGQRPGFPPIRPGVYDDPWLADQFTKGLQGLFNFLRSRSGNDTSGGGDDGECYRRWNGEDNRCYSRHPKWWAGCKERAERRRDLCIRNGGRPNPYEPAEWSKADEETSFYPDR